MDAKKPMPPVPTKPPAQQTQVAKRDAQPPAQVNAPPDLEEVMRAKMTAITRDDFFKVGGKKNERGQWEDKLEPNARVLQKWANDNDGHPINSEIIEATSTKDGCFVKVRGWIGDKNKPLVEKEEVVDVTFAHELEFLLTEAVAKGIKVPKTDGSWGTETVRPPFNVEFDEVTGVSRIVLTNPEHQIHVLAEWVRLKRFALRGAVTKAEKRIYKKLLGAEWRDEEEIKIEKDEVQQVAEDKGFTPPPGTDAPPPPPNTERLIPEGKKPNGTGTVTPMAVKSLLTRFKDLGDKFPSEGDQFSHEQYLTECAMGLMFERGAAPPEPTLEVMTPADSGKLWELIDQVSKGSEEALQRLDTLNTHGQKVIATLHKRVQK